MVKKIINYVKKNFKKIKHIIFTILYLGFLIYYIYKYFSIVKKTNKKGLIYIINNDNKFACDNRYFFFFGYILVNSGLIIYELINSLLEII